MKHRRWAFLTVAILCLSCISIPVFAHPGRTDSNGGHTDHDTGEYHYHHGYPAHDHYDMDGDGDVDCPYDFDDQTNHDSGTSSNPETTKSARDMWEEYKESVNNSSHGSSPNTGRESAETSSLQSSNDSIKNQYWWLLFIPVSLLCSLCFYLLDKYDEKISSYPFYSTVIFALFRYFICLVALPAFILFWLFYLVMIAILFPVNSIQQKYKKLKK